ncbi:MAG TPA: hypothetical protein VIS94_17725 [Desulfomonilia bacterium]
MIIKQTALFEKPGEHNTKDCLAILKNAVSQGLSRHVVVASTSGRNAKAFFEALKGADAGLIIVTHCANFKEENHDEFDPRVRRMLKENGVPVYTGTILTSSLEKSVMDKFGGSSTGALIAGCLRRFGEGAKVCIEIVMEACDAGLIPEGAEVLAAAGTGHGSDTVMLIKSRPSRRFLDLEVLEILAMPRGR